MAFLQSKMRAKKEETVTVSAGPGFGDCHGRLTPA
jgi:hypothetical protein